ncbi:MAG: helix-turn-helix domain-containing protein [Candidatus Omnitrophica bacterium]|nr:helix-turn-helix domain-containing protein [Candidatus Omnitrophota bacterium]
MENLGMTIRKSREELALKVYELAREVGISSVYITQIEKHGKLPSPSVMKRISEVLCNEQLFGVYLKMKYPVVYGKANKREIGSVFNRTNEVLVEELMKMRKILERIEKRIN